MEGMKDEGRERKMRSGRKEGKERGKNREEEQADRE